MGNQYHNIHDGSMCFEDFLGRTVELHIVRGKSTGGTKKGSKAILEEIESVWDYPKDLVQLNAERVQLNAVANFNILIIEPHS